jgi:hypothetical protein
VRSGGKDRIEILETKLLELAATQNLQHTEAREARQEQDGRIAKIEGAVTVIATNQESLGKSTNSLEQMMAQLASGQLEIQRTCGGLAQSMESMRNEVAASLASGDTGTGENSSKVRRLGN